MSKIVLSHLYAKQGAYSHFQILLFCHSTCFMHIVWLILYMYIYIHTYIYMLLKTPTASHRRPPLFGECGGIRGELILGTVLENCWAYRHFSFWCRVVWQRCKREQAVQFSGALYKANLPEKRNNNILKKVFRKCFQDHGKMINELFVFSKLLNILILRGVGEVAGRSGSQGEHHWQKMCENAHQMSPT